ncbi:MAG: recombinase RecA, partial [Treponema sp.]|nr:recombinase RecA [Treponema sp.]
EKVGQGKENALKFLEDNPDWAKQIEAQIRQEVFPGQILRTREGVAVYPEQEKAVKDAKKAAEKEAKEAEKEAKKAMKADERVPEPVVPSASEALF